MKRFFGREEDDVPSAVPEAPDDPPPAGEVAEPLLPSPPQQEAEAPNPGPATPWGLPLTPARRPASRPDKTATTADEDTPGEAGAPGTGGLAARVDILLSVTRSFRDTVSSRLSDFGSALATQTDSDLALRRSVERLERQFAELSADVGAVAGTLESALGTLESALGELRAADLPGTAERLGDTVGDMARADEQSRAEMRGDVAALGTRLDGVELAIAGLSNELTLLRRRIPVTRRPTVERETPPASPQRRRGR